METRTFYRIIGYGGLLLLWAGMLAGQDTIVQGTYKGQWTGAGGSGDIHITFRDAGDGKLTPEVGFTLGGEDVVCKVVSFKPDGASFTMVYEFDAQGNPLRSAIEATVKGKTIEGTYKTTAGDQAVDSGTWKATAI
jgi:hypothetical protein